ncbi:hypothetical protein [Chamaesiphon sp.]|uniref:hypothetical protein n=1 Tax=Chamaesiphon sp. TaxID=2814140 RepID=UPI003593F486
MKKLISVLLLCSTAILLPLTAHAEDVNNRLYRQERRLYNGVRQGTVTRSESQMVRQRLNAIKATRYRHMRKGTYTPTAQRRLNSRLDNTSKTIYRVRRN